MLKQFPKISILLILMVMLWSGIARSESLVTVEATGETGDDISVGTLRDTVFSLVSSAENSSTDYRKQYAYIEDIGDGRGYTAGVIGFTSGTGDLLKVVRLYNRRKSGDSVLAAYIPALKAVNGTDSHKGLGKAFKRDWKIACKDTEMIDAQNQIVDEMYLRPAVAFAKADGLSSLGQYIYYDALVVHGPGEDKDSFGGIREAGLSKATPPSQGGSEANYLLTFLDVREGVMLKEEAHSDLSRLIAQRKWIAEGNFALKRPLRWVMYGDTFILP